MLEDLLKRLREAGWMVASHNDYRQHGEFHTFWLFTQSDAGEFVKGEGHSDIEALGEIYHQLEWELCPTT